MKSECYLFHKWKTVIDTGINRYRQCKSCHKRIIVKYGILHQPQDIEWIKTGLFTEMKPPKLTKTKTT